MRRSVTKTIIIPPRGSEPLLILGGNQSRVGWLIQNQNTVAGDVAKITVDQGVADEGFEVFPTGIFAMDLGFGNPVYAVSKSVNPIRLIITDVTGFDSFQVSLLKALGVKNPEALEKGV